MFSRTIQVVLLSLALKLSYLLLAVGLGWNFKTLTPLPIETEFDNIVSIFYRGDSGWYYKIATEWHTPTPAEDLYDPICRWCCQSTFAFFPLYPALLIATQQLTGLSFLTNAFLLQLILSTVAFVLFYKLYLAILKHPTLAFQTTLILIFFPFHYYFSQIYTESLFFLVVVGSFYAVYKRRYGWFMLTTTLMVLSRPNGLVILLPLLLYLYEQDEDGYIGIFSWRKNLKNLALFVPAVVAFGAYCVYLYQMTGDFFAFSTAQKAWNRSFMFPLFALFRDSTWEHQYQSVFVIGVLLLALWKIWVYRLSLQLFFWFNLLLPLTAGSTISMPRFLSVNFPFSLMLGRLFPPQWSRLFGIVFLWVLHLISYYFWLIERQAISS